MITEIKATFEANRNSEQAVWMEKYMKGRFLYLGIKAPQRNLISAPFYSKVKSYDREALINLVEDLWGCPEREYQYLAVELLKKNVKKLVETDFEFIRKLIEAKSWWDTVDLIASNILGTHLLRFPILKLRMDDWIGDGNMWIRRSAIIYQLKYKQHTDEDKLFGYCLMCAEEKEFFIRKAIGWSLRQHAKLFPENVRQFVNANENVLSNLSRKEALRSVS